MKVKQVFNFALACLVSVFLFAGTRLFAQASLFDSANWQGAEEKGPTAEVQARGSSSHNGEVTTFDVSLGYNLNSYIGVDAGVPFYFVRRPSFFANNRDAGRIWMDGLGDPYVDLRFNGTSRGVNVLSVVTGTAPTASFRKGMTMGRVGVDWYNHVDGSIHGFTPFANFGLGNALLDRHVLPRPYLQDLPFRTFGFQSNFEGGLSYKLWRKFELGASMYAIVPAGNQRVYSELVRQDMPASSLSLLTPDNHGRAWETAFETTGPARLDRDNGYSGFLSFSPLHAMDVQVGYVHSVRYAMDRVTFTLAFNANAIARKLTNF
jgi:hypothetical protein